MRTAVLYVLFAIFSILVNIATQASVIHVVSFGHPIPLSVAAGTLTGLVTKYVLDRRYIFNASRGATKGEWRSFLMYAGTGAVTTLIFWGTEFAFHVAFQADLYRYLGGALGLAMGYFLKYRLDRDLVFRLNSPKERAAQ